VLAGQVLHVDHVMEVCPGDVGLAELVDEPLDRLDENLAADS
jgi:hypothetical protein